jgi:hypothetical protein
LPDWAGRSGVAWELIMKLVLTMAAATAVLAVSAPPASAQPPGSYREQCRNIAMQGQFLSAQCRSARGGWASSSINVASCASDIGVDHEGGLTCRGPGAGRPPPPGAYPPPDVRPPPPGHRGAITIYDRFGFRGRSLRVDGPMPNLSGTRFNDRVASVQLGRRTGPWLVCADANYRGRCVTVDSDVRDVDRIGMLSRISSLRPLR